MLTSIRASFAALAWSSALLLLSLGEVDREKVCELEQAATLHIEWNTKVYNTDNTIYQCILICLPLYMYICNHMFNVLTK